MCYFYVNRNRTYISRMPNLLIIEDDAAFCQMLQKFLTKRGYEVETSFNAPDAKQKIQKSNFEARNGQEVPGWSRRAVFN